MHLSSSAICRYIEDGQFNNTTGNDLAKLYAKQPGLIPVDDFTQGDRERVLELLLSQERVVSLIYAKTFPINPNISHKPNAMDGTGTNVNGGTLASEFNNLLDSGDYPSSPTNNGTGNIDHRPSTTGALQGGNGGNTSGGNNGNSNNNNNSSSTKGGLTLPPVNQARGISR